MSDIRTDYSSSSGLSLAEFDRLLYVSTAPDGSEVVMPVALRGDESMLSTQGDAAERTTEELWAIMKRAGREMEALRSAIAEAAGARTEPVELTVSAMVVTVLLFSVLDHVAATIRAPLTPVLGVNEFSPYYPIGESEKDIAKHFPGLERAFPSRYAVLLDTLEYAGMADFKNATNAYKHRGLRRIAAHKEIMGSRLNGASTPADFAAFRADDLDEYKRHVVYTRYYFEPDANDDVLATLDAYYHLATSAIGVLVYED